MVYLLTNHETHEVIELTATTRIEAMEQVLEKRRLSVTVNPDSNTITDGLRELADLARKSEDKDVIYLPAEDQKGIESGDYFMQEIGEMLQFIGDMLE